jgi:hypothetical protein
LQPIYIHAAELSVFGDILVWHASQETASTWANVVSKPSNKVIDFDAANIDFNWDTGFRAGLQYQAEHDTRDTKLYWTHFSTKTTGKHALAEQILAPEFFSGFVSNNLFFGGNLDWKIAMNMLDLDLGRRIDVGKSVSIRPSIGLKSGSIKQTINANWNAVIYTATENVQHNFHGIGPSVGIDSKWNIYQQFSLIGNFSTAFMWGKWKINDVYNRPAALLGLVTPTTITTTMKKTLLGTMMFDYFVGFEWFHKGKFDLALQLGYELQFWANQLRIPTFQILPVHGDLTLQGGTCHIRISL